LRDTLVDQEAQFLNQPGNVGFEFLDMLVEPAQGGGIQDPHFLARAWEFQAALKDVPQARETTSILGAVQQIACESFKKPFPETPEEVEAAFFLIDNRLAPTVQRQLYFLGGVRVSVSYGGDDSVEFGRFCDAVLTLARTKFADLKVSTFGKTTLFPQVDAYVRTGKISNVVTSQFGVVAICGMLIAWRNRRSRGTWLSPWRGGLVMSLPLLFATAVMGLIMWVFDIAIDMSTAAITALAINAATDFSLYLAMTYQALLAAHAPDAALQEALGRQGRVIVADCILNTLCFLPLVTSRFLPIRQIGWMMAVMLIACAIGTLIFMAALLPRCVVEARAISEQAPDQIERISAPSA
jgi:predicted RND superfamily exporter protein